MNCRKSYLINSRMVLIGLFVILFFVKSGCAMEWDNAPVRVTVWDESVDMPVSVSVPQWQIDQMSIVKAFQDEGIKRPDLTAITEEKETHDGYSTGDIVVVSKQELEVLRGAFNAVAKNELINYVFSLGNKWRDLVNAAQKVGAYQLSATLVSVLVPGAGKESGPQKELIVSRFIDPVVDYCMSGSVFESLLGHKKNVERLVMSADGSTLFTTGDGNRDDFFLWDLKKNTKKQMKLGYSNFLCSSLAISPNGSHVLMGLFDGNEEKLVMINTQTGDVSDFPYDGGFVRALGWSNDGSKLFCGLVHQPNNIFMIDMNTKERAYFEGFEHKVYCAAMSPDGTKIAVGGDGDNENNFMVWDIETKKVLHSISFDKDIYRIAFNPSNSEQVVFGSIGSLVFVDIKTGEQKDLMVGGRSFVCIAWSADGRYIAVGNDELKSENFALLDLVGHKTTYLVGHSIGMIGVIRYDACWPTCVAFSPDSRYIYSGSSHSDSKGNFIKWSVLNEEDKESLYNLTVAQAKLVYKRYKMMEKDQMMELLEGTPEYELYETLPENVKNIISRFFTQPCEKKLNSSRWFF